MNYVEACQIVLRYLQILKDKPLYIVQSKGDPSKVEEIVPYLISVLWAGTKLNIPQFRELSIQMTNYFGPAVNDCVQKKHEVD